MSDEKYEIEKRDDSLPFRLMDALDDQLIIAELEGRMPEILTYHFSDKGQEVWGLSKAGVDEATGELSKQGEVIRELELNFTDGETEAFFTVKAGRYVVSRDGKEILLDTKFGTKRQSKKTARGNDNTFWYEQGSIKACRNASMRLIPKTIVQAVIESAKQKGKVKEIKKEEIKTNGVTVEDVKETFSEPQDMELFKKESEKKCAEYHDRMVAVKNVFELRNYYKKHYNEMEKVLLPEHLETIKQLKDSLKEKLSETTKD